MAKRVKVPISTARTEIFKLAELVRQTDDAVVVLEQRGGVEPVALVREARLAYLEDRVSQLDRQQPIAVFTLAGSLTTEMPDDVIEQSLRDSRLAWGGPRETAGHSGRKASSKRRRA